MKAGNRWKIILLCIFALNGSIACAEPTDGSAEADEAGNGTVDWESVKEAIKAIPTPNMYRAPQMLEVNMEDTKLSCIQLDNTIVALEPLTYRVVPGFYDGDIYQTVAFWAGTTNFHDDKLGLPLATLPFDIPLPYAYFGYVMYKRYEESERIYHVSHRIAQMRRVKAQKRCFES